MATNAAELEIFSGAPAAPPRRPRVLLVGTVLAAAGSCAALLGLIALYAQQRADVIAGGQPWLPQETVLPLTPGNMGMFTLLLSAVTAAWAVYALRNEDRSHAFFALGLTLLFGAAFIVDTAYLWQNLALGIADSTQATLIYTITGSQVAMVGGGMLFLLVMGFRALGGQLTGRAAEGMQAATLFWFVTIAMCAVVWYTIYVTK
jgi:cytochrome c oxidase subunit 3